MIAFKGSVIAVVVFLLNNDNKSATKLEISKVLKTMDNIEILNLLDRMIKIGILEKEGMKYKLAKSKVIASVILEEMLELQKEHMQNLQMTKQLLEKVKELDLRVLE
jgi:hypothetical protein